MIDFTFLAEPAGFALSEGWARVGITSSYAWVLWAGLLNTIKVVLPALVLATLLGALVGMMRLSRDRAIARVGDSYVGLFRNVPLLLQLLAAYFVLAQALPEGHEAWVLGPGVFFSKSGLAVPALTVVGVQVPVQGRFSVEGGWVLTLEYLAVLLALVVYTSSFIAEVVRAGMLAVPVGLQQGGLALGLNAWQLWRLVTLPVALRLMVPSLSNQYLNCLKNASLGVAVGYPELVSVSQTSMNQSGRAVECIVLVMLVYVLLSLLCTGLMNGLNRCVNRGVF